METKAPASSAPVRELETNITQKRFPDRNRKVNIFSFDIPAEEKLETRITSPREDDKTKALKAAKPPRGEMSGETGTPRNEGIASPDANIPSFTNPTAPKLTVQQSSLRRVPLAEKLDLLVLGSKNETVSESRFEGEGLTFDESNLPVQAMAVLALSIEASEVDPNSTIVKPPGVLAAGITTAALGMLPERHDTLVSEPALSSDLNPVEQDVRHIFGVDRKQPGMGGSRQATMPSVHITELVTHFAPVSSRDHPETTNSSLPSTEAKVELREMQAINTAINNKLQSSITLPIDLELVPPDQAPSGNPAQVVSQIGSNIVGELKSVTPQSATSSLIRNPDQPEEPTKVASVIRSLSIELYPASLGEVKVDLQLRDGQLRVKLGATTVQAKQQIEQELKTLAQMLSASGYEVSELLIETARFAEREQPSEPTSQRPSNTSTGLTSGQGFQNEHDQRHEGERSGGSEGGPPKGEQLDIETPQNITRRIVV